MAASPDIFQETVADSTSDSDSATKISLHQDLLSLVIDYDTPTLQKARDKYQIEPSLLDAPALQNTLQRIGTFHPKLSTLALEQSAMLEKTLKQIHDVMFTEEVAMHDAATIDDPASSETKLQQ